MLVSERFLLRSVRLIIKFYVFYEFSSRRAHFPISFASASMVVFIFHLINCTAAVFPPSACHCCSFISLYFYRPCLTANGREIKYTHSFLRRLELKFILNFMRRMCAVGKYSTITHKISEFMFY